MSLGLKQVCKVTGHSFNVSEAELEFLRRVAELNPQLGLASLPPPSIYPTQITRQICCFGNAVNLFKTESAISGKSQLSRYNPAFGYHVSTIDEFWSDVDNTKHGMSYDFSRPFFEQWNELMHKAYLLPLGNARVENSDFANGARDIKNCYLIFAASQCEDCLYCLGVFNSNDLIDCVGANQCQFCYSCADIENCYECQHCRDSYNCSTCISCIDCRSCNNCIGCVGLTSAEYCIYNEKVSKVQFDQFIAKTKLGSFHGRSEFLKTSKQFQSSYPHSVNRIINCEDCSGAYLFDSQNLFHCYHATGSRDCGYMCTAMNSNDCWYGYAFGSDLQYQAANYNSYNSHFSYLVFDGKTCCYSFLLFNGCTDCFGCVGLKKNSYCILNKQYSKNEYFELLPRIVAHMQSTGEWGEYFPLKYSPHSYQESWVEDYHEAIAEPELIRRGFRMVPVPISVAPYGALSAQDIPDLIDEVNVDSILTKALICNESGQGYSLQRKELAFYKKFNIPLPRQNWRLRIKRLTEVRERIPDQFKLE